MRGNPITVTTTFVYDTDGQLVQEFGPSTDSTISYLTVDHLGSTRLVTDINGAPKKRYDYLPFGEEPTSGTGGRTVLMGYNMTATANPLKAQARPLGAAEEQRRKTHWMQLGRRAE